MCVCVFSYIDAMFVTNLSFELKVLKVDGAYVAVKFPGTSSSVSSQSAAPTDSDPSSLLQDCRLLRIDELQVPAHARTQSGNVCLFALNVYTLNILNFFFPTTGC